MQLKLLGRKSSTAAMGKVTDVRYCIVAGDEARSRIRFELILLDLCAIEGVYL